jgi:signal transduction histidine kinase
MAKYSKANDASIVIKTTDHTLQLLITDNGTGFKAENSFAGNGLKNMKARTAELNGELKIESKINFGSSISLIIPVK